MKFAKLSLVGIACMWLAACASGATSDAMVASQGQPAMANYQGPKVMVTELAGGSETNPLWTSQVSNAAFKGALLKTLANEGMLGGPDAPYALSAILIELNQPFIGFSYTVKSKVKYVLSDQGGNMLMDETVEAEGDASVGDAFLGVERLRLANENSIRNNIAELLKRLRDVLGVGTPGGEAIDAAE